MSSPDDTILGSYRLVRLLGRGGMGEVHLARDNKLERDVALKLLPEDLAQDPERRTRFLREARAAAALNHPNITTIHDVGRAGGRDYIAQEYLDGQSLADMVLEHTLPVAELAELAVPLAEALSYAHEQGVIHRDLKAGNVMVTGRGHPKLLDFGLAKVIHDASATASSQSTTLTIHGAIFGTPSSMSPEQALGHTVDARSDIFSFGSLLYEMAAGKPPFLGTTVQETLDKVVHEAPEPLSRLRRDLPADFIAIVEKAHRKEPDERYQRMEDLAADLRHFKRTTDSGMQPAAAPRPAPRRGIPSGMLALAVAAIVLAVWQPWTGSGDADPVVAVADGAPSYAAVMYVENLTDPDDALHLGTMLAHLLTTELSASRGLDMLSQQRLFETAQQLGQEDGAVDKTIASQVASMAGVSTMVLGQVSTVGQTLLATVTMVDVDTGAEVATARAEGTTEADLFDMAESLGEQVRIALTGGTEADAPGRQLTTSIEAYRSYVQAQQAMADNEFDLAADLFTEATDLDPAFALANFWLGISLQWAFGTVDEAVLAMERALVHSERLPTDVAPVARAALLHIRGEYGEALDILEQVALDAPDNVVAHYLLGEMRLHSSVHGDAGEAARRFARTLEIDPGFTMIQDHLLAALVFAGDGEAATALIDTWEFDREPDRLRLQRNTAERRGQLELAADLQAQMPRTRGGVEPPPTGSLEHDRDWIAGLPLRLAQDPEAAPAIRSHNAAPILIRLGRFDEAREHLPAMAAPSQGAVAYDWETNCWAAARQDEAFLHELAGDLTAARAAALRGLDVQPLAYRSLYVNALLAARDGDTPSARQFAGQLDALVEQGLGVMAPVYRDAAWGEIALADGDTEEACRLYGRAVERNTFMNDWWSDNRSFGPVIREGLARALLAHDDPEGARQALRALLDAQAESNDTGLLHVIRARYTLGALELEAGDVDAGREQLERFLAHWGDSAWELPQVQDARDRLAAL